MFTNFRSVSFAAVSGALLVLGSSMAFAAMNADNTSAGESGHGTGCSNHPITNGSSATNCGAISQGASYTPTTASESTSSGDVDTMPFPNYGNSVRRGQHREQHNL
jgi:hypothetical protein